jgi:penicillin-binding protein 2
MLIFDQLRREDPAMRLVALGVLVGLTVLLVGLWWTQIVRYRVYESDLQTQSYRSVRVPAPRGKIVDRNGVELANNQPVYNISLYLEEMRGPFQQEYQRRKLAVKSALSNQRKTLEQRLGRELTKEESRKFTFTYAQAASLGAECRYAVASNLTAEVSAYLGVPIQLDPAEFAQHYAKNLYVPMRILKELSPHLVARFEERFSGVAGLNLDGESRRVYPQQSVGAHALGYLWFDDRSVEGEEAYYSYRLPDYRGLIGIEGGFDEELRGHAGGKWVLVNNLGYRQEESYWQPTVPGANAVLTIDLRVQQAAEQALKNSGGVNTRGAVVVMDVRNGDILALASSPTYNPNNYVRGFPPGEWARLNDEELKPQFNRATQDIYQPGSIFKIVVGMAALELGLNPTEIHTLPPHPTFPNRGIAVFGRNQSKVDTAPPGTYNFRKAFAKSSNKYFIDAGLRPGVLEKMVDLGRRLHLGERTGMPTRQESAGHFPKPEHLRSGWSVGTTANLCIGQERIDVTPLQMALMISAVANGGTVYWPRLVQRLESQDPLAPVVTQTFETGRVRDRLGVSKRTLTIVQDAMLADTEPGGTGVNAVVPGFPIGAKTGTAQNENIHNVVEDQTTWFASYGPWQSPRYAVIVMIEGGQSGGTTCAPVARKIYETIKQLEQPGAPLAVTRRN